MLQPHELAELRQLVATGRTASAALSFIRNLVDQGRVDDVPNAIRVASETMEVNGSLGRRYLANRVPALLVNSLYRKHPTMSSQLISSTSWSSRVVDAVESGDGGRLAQAMTELEQSSRV